MAPIVKVDLVDEVSFTDFLLQGPVYVTFLAHRSRLFSQVSDVAHGPLVLNMLFVNYCILKYTYMTLTDRVFVEDCFIAFAFKSFACRYLWQQTVIGIIVLRNIFNVLL